jgi:hypothetical protein
MQYALCRHIKTNGTQCEAPSLSNDQWCFFHSRLHQRHSRFRPIEVASDSIVRAQPVHLSALEDRESVQVALSVVINALASGQMEPRQATALLYGLQIASSNLARMNSNPSPSKVVLSAEPTSDGQFLAEPGAIYEISDEPPPNLTWDPVEEDEDEDQEEEGDDTPIERWIDPRSR